VHERTLLILRPRGEDEIGERDREYRHAKEESVDNPLRLFVCLSFLLRKRDPSTNAFWHVADFHVAASLFPQRARAVPLR
jgi:hypothetical protein